MNMTSLMVVLQTFSKWFYILCETLGVTTICDHGQPIMTMLRSEVKKYQPDPLGNFIERTLAEIEEHKDDPDHVYHGERGHTHLVGTLLDLFLAGNHYFQRSFRKL